MDTFEGASCGILSWLQEQPDSTGVELMDRLIRRDPERHSKRRLRVLLRRIRQWRGVMAKQPVYDSVGDREINGV